MKEVKRYFLYMGRKLPLYLFILTVTLITESALNILYSYINKSTLNAVEYQDRQMFISALALCIVVVVLKCLFPYLRYFEIKLVRKMVFDIKMRLFDKLMKLEMQYYEKNHSGEALKTLNWDANSLKDSWFSHVYWVLGKITLGISSLTAMLIYSPILTVISIVICVITVLVSVWLNNEMKKSAVSIQKNTAGLAKYLSDILAGFPILKMYSGSCIVLEHYMNENRNVTVEENERVKKAALLEMLSFLLGIAGSFGTIIAGTYFVAKKGMDYGTVMAVVTLQMALSNTMQRLGSSLAVFSTSLVKAGRVFDFLELECEEKQSGAVGINSDQNINANENINVNMTPIEINNLNFSYVNEANQECQTMVFKGFNMSVGTNEKMAIMGESGCGKSTLLKLLLRFYPVENGMIKIYGKDINCYPVRQLRDIITYIPQESYLFEGTIAENISYGSNRQCSLEDIVEAAKSAYADDFIKQMKDGYDTWVSSGGRNMSGGQRQRIALARGFLKKSPILIMDEPSSALDSQSEQIIREALKRLMEDKVVLMVTHRKLCPYCGYKGFDVK